MLYIAIPMLLIYIIELSIRKNTSKPTIFTAYLGGIISVVLFMIIAANRVFSKGYSVSTFLGISWSAKGLAIFSSEAIGPSSGLISFTITAVGFYFLGESKEGGIVIFLAFLLGFLIGVF